MKCPKCQSDMVQSQKGFLCLQCGHVETASPHSVPLTPADTPASAAAPAPGGLVLPEAKLAAPAENDSTPQIVNHAPAPSTPDPAPAEVATPTTPEPAVPPAEEPTPALEATAPSDPTPIPSNQPAGVSATVSPEQAAQPAPAEAATPAVEPTPDADPALTATPPVPAAPAAKAVDGIAAAAPSEASGSATPPSPPRTPAVAPVPTPPGASAPLQPETHPEPIATTAAVAVALLFVSGTGGLGVLGFHYFIH